MVASHPPIDPERGVPPSPRPPVQTGFHVDARWPAVVLILAATIIPIGLRPPVVDVAELLRFDALDAVENVVGYLPIGMAFSGFGLARGTAFATLMALLAETVQSVMLFRDPSLVDVATNGIGALIGGWCFARCRPSRWVRCTPRRSALAGLTALCVGLAMHWQNDSAMPNLRGCTLPGQLEGHWALDDSETEDRVADASGHGLQGLRLDLQPLPATFGSADAAGHFRAQYVDLGNPRALSMLGSLSISAWIRARADPADDAAIVSNHDGATGYQLDTTVDTGARTIGFKLVNQYGQVVARYGATTLAINRWYHVAAVYDAQARAMNVYLDGQLDNGTLDHAVTAVQVPSKRHTYIGRRGDLLDYPFLGEIRDVNIFSGALSPSEVFQLRHAAEPGHWHATPSPAAAGRYAGPAVGACPVIVPDQARSPAGVSLIGALVCFAGLGLASGARRWVTPTLGVTLAAALGQFAVPMIAGESRWFLLAATVAGYTAVFLSASLTRARQTVHACADAQGSAAPWR